MLWTDPPKEPSEDARRVLRMLELVGPTLAAVVVVFMFVVTLY
ncbi:morphogenic membrane protein MmpB [Allostreptomyces psammosilenae]|uniref:Uncharacterized protein n=1 Tax=Allostreptomyces psammosilenae TaxID=1892865 RepID=A0A852ZZI3_9ACTN|nr:hypothetical protein [Allostreptomyces psammosilenae]NYI06104.1 hypothetical protein [Allostreptomyces psammosilenae]